MRLYNPIYHFKRAVSDIRALRHGFATLGQPQTFTSVDHLSHVLRGRLLLAASVAIPATIIGIISGTIYQNESGSIPGGLLLNLVIANTLGFIGIEVLWAWLSRDLYHAIGKPGWKKLPSVFQDLRVVHLHSLIGVLIINTLSMGLTTFVLENMHHWQPRWNLNRFVPAPLISPIIGWLLLDAPFIRHMNDLYDTEARKLACRYQGIVITETGVVEECTEADQVAEQVIQVYELEKPENKAHRPEKDTRETPRTVTTEGKGMSDRLSGTLRRLL